MGTPEHLPSRLQLYAILAEKAKGASFPLAPFILGAETQVAPISMVTLIAKEAALKTEHKVKCQPPQQDGDQ